MDAELGSPTALESEIKSLFQLNAEQLAPLVSRIEFLLHSTRQQITESIELEHFLKAQGKKVDNTLLIQEVLSTAVIKLEHLLKIIDAYHCAQIHESTLELYNLYNKQIDLSERTPPPSQEQQASDMEAVHGAIESLISQCESMLKPPLLSANARAVIQEANSAILSLFARSDYMTKMSEPLSGIIERFKETLIQSEKTLEALKKPFEKDRAFENFVCKAIIASQKNEPTPNAQITEIEARTDELNKLYDDMQNNFIDFMQAQAEILLEIKSLHQDVAEKEALLCHLSQEIHQTLNQYRAGIQTHKKIIAIYQNLYAHQMLRQRRIALLEENHNKALRPKVDRDTLYIKMKDLCQRIEEFLKTAPIRLRAREQSALENAITTLIVPTRLLKDYFQDLLPALGAFKELQQDSERFTRIFREAYRLKLALFKITEMYNNQSSEYCLKHPKLPKSGIGVALTPSSLSPKRIAGLQGLDVGQIQSFLSPQRTVGLKALETSTPQSFEPPKAVALASQPAVASLLFSKKSASSPLVSTSSGCTSSYVSSSSYGSYEATISEISSPETSASMNTLKKNPLI